MDISFVFALLAVVVAIVVPWHSLPTWGRVLAGLGLGALVILWFITRSLPTGLADNARRQDLPDSRDDEPRKDQDA